MFYSYLMPLLQAQGATQQSALASFLPLILIFAVFYFLFIRPQQKKAKETKERQQNLTKGDIVVTIGGLHGVVDTVKEETVVIKGHEGVLLEFNKAAIGAVNPQKEVDKKKK